MTISWNVVNHTGQAFDVVAKKAFNSISKLEHLLGKFPQAAVHLQVIFNQNPHKKIYSTKMNLRVPSNILHAEKSSKSMVQSLENTAHALARQLNKVKSAYRKDSEWKRRSTRTKLQKLKTFFAEVPLPEGKGPRHLEDMVGDLLKRDYNRLLDYVQRQIADYVASGTIIRGVVDARDVVDRVAQISLRHPHLKSPDMNMIQWFLGIAFHETRRAVRQYLQDAKQTVPLDIDVYPKGALALAEEHDDGESFKETVWEEVEPPEASELEYIPNPSVKTPDVTADEKSLVDALRNVVEDWPKVQKDVFDMYFLEGFDPAEIAMVFNWKLDQVNKLIEKIQLKIRERMIVIMESRYFKKASSKRASKAVKR